jgi:hypothetical protein
MKIEKKIKISPCCRSIAWNYIQSDNDDWKMTRCRCKLCDKEFSTIDLVIIKNGFNPVTYYCDKCMLSEEDSLTNSKE